LTTQSGSFLGQSKTHQAIFGYVQRIKV